jgi:hypothetical protein
MTQPKAPPRCQQKQSCHHGMVVGGICADMHILLSSDAKEAEGANRSEWCVR